ncbi:cation diffusion facilitator family transporter [Chondromyces crocatus]|uniref:Cation-efflux pump FieF n=1 Tax=Chondromyces crocatus TaxID=52 RepID=A0A0K1EJ28_CHOCO|nr:cation diffusion facilitator family transporter [Chondromyces crocatus]AKT40578.1 iron transporter [Chondromyces crocatus]
MAPGAELEGSASGLLAALDDQGARLVRRATYASVATAASLALLKLLAFWLTGSVSLLSSMVDSTLDAIASLFMLLAVRQAQSPPDAEHRFGHGKAEPLAALAQAVFIAGSALFIVVQAIQRISAPEPLAHPWIGVAVMVLSMGATFGLIRYQAWVLSKGRSLAVKADSVHYASDLLVNGGVLLALGLSHGLGWALADPMIAIAIALYVGRTAWRLIVDAVDMLMDRELPEAERQRIIALVGEEQEVKGFHDLRTRVAGPQVFIQLHVEFDGTLSLGAAHAITDRLEKRLSAAFGGAEVLIHQDLYGGGVGTSP